MTYEPLHHKYRPQTFGDLVGQDAIAQTLTNAINTERIAPAYLFTGPRGTGKTSSARILAKSLNCLASDVPTPTPCGTCDVCQGIAKGATLDVIEIDAASNTGVDNIRDLIERAQFAPVQCRYKVYVIDECHMLSISAFNSLLKTLEEPPDRVIFVLATTDPQRVLPTIISRCQRFDFRRIPLEAMTAHLQKISRQENINIADDAVKMVAQIAQGGLRDAESLLDQLSLLTGEITVDKVWDLVGAVPENDLLALLEVIKDDKPTPLVELARHLMDRGREPLVVLQNLAGFYRDLLIAKTAPQQSHLVALTQPTWEKLCHLAQQWEIEQILASQKHLQTSEVQIKNTAQPRLWLEVTLLGLLPSASRLQVQATETSVRITTPAPSQSPAPTPTSAPVPKKEVKSSGEPSPVPLQATSASIQPEIPPPPPPSPGVSVPPEGNLHQVWEEVLAQIRPFGTQSLLRQHGHLIGFNGSAARVAISSQPLLNMVKDKVPNIEAAFQRVFNQSIKVRLEVFTGETSTTLVRESVDSSVSPPPATGSREMGPSNPEIASPPLESLEKQPLPSSPESVRSREVPPELQWHQPEVSVGPDAQAIALRNEAQAVTQAADRLANLFGGQSMHLPEDADFWESLAVERWEPKLDLVELGNEDWSDKESLLDLSLEEDEEEDDLPPF